MQLLMEQQLIEDPAYLSVTLKLNFSDINLITTYSSKGHHEQHA